MKKRLFSTMACALVMIFVLAFGVNAAENHPPRVADNAGLLTAQEVSSLQAKLDDYSAEYNVDIAVVTVPNYTQYDAMDAADDYYDYNGYGLGEDNSGVMLFIAMDDGEGGRDYWITTTGSAIDAISDYDIDYISDAFLDDLKAGYYYSAFDTFADKAYAEIKDANTFHAVGVFISSLIVGLIVAGIYLLILFLQLKSIAANDKAAEYVKKGSLNVTESKEVYLYKNVTSVLKQSSSSSSGGSSTHTGSSGTSHGGGGGKF